MIATYAHEVASWRVDVLAMAAVFILGLLAGKMMSGGDDA